MTTMCWKDGENRREGVPGAGAAEDSAAPSGIRGWKGVPGRTQRLGGWRRRNFGGTCRYLGNRREARLMLLKPLQFALEGGAR